MMNLTRVTVTGIAAVALMAATGFAQDVPVEGQVVNKEDGQPVAGVFVRVIIGDSREPQVLETGEQGKFSFRAAPGSPLTVTVPSIRFSEWHGIAAIRTVVPEDQTGALSLPDIEALPVVQRTIKIVDEQSRPVVDAGVVGTVSVHGRAGIPVRSAERSDAFGIVELPVPRGSELTLPLHVQFGNDRIAYSEIVREEPFTIRGDFDWNVIQGIWNLVGPDDSGKSDAASRVQLAIGVRTLWQLSGREPIPGLTDIRSRPKYELAPHTEPKQIVVSEAGQRRVYTYELDEEFLTLTRPGATPETADVVLRFRRDSAEDNLADISDPHIRRKLLERTILEFVDAPLSDAAEHLSLLHDTQIALDEAALAAAGIKPDLSLRLTLSGVRLETALRMLLPLHGLGYEVRESTIVIIPAEQATQPDGTR